jgi:hypothetical protein
MMIKVLVPWVLLSTTSFPTPASSQVLGGDPDFPVLNEIRWEMSASDIQGLCKNRWRQTMNTDSTMVYNASFLGIASRVKIQIDMTSKKPRMIDIGFEDATVATRDTLVNHFTRMAGKAPVVTTKEKSAIIFTIKFEMALWKSGSETIGVMTGMRGSSVIAVSLILTPTSLVQK